jgi:hypothetical protein
VTPQDDQPLFLEIRSPGRDPTSVYAPVFGQPLVGLLSGAGTHQLRVTGTEAGAASFVIETQQVGREP